MLEEAVSLSTITAHAVEAMRADTAVTSALLDYEREFPDDVVRPTGSTEDEAPIPRWIFDRLNDFNVRSIAGPIYLAGALPYVLIDSRGVFTPAGIGLSVSLPPDASGTSGNQVAATVYNYTPSVFANCTFDQLNDGRFITRDLAVLGLSSGFVIGNTLALHGYRGITPQQLALDSTKEFRPRDDDAAIRWSSDALTLADSVAGSRAIEFEPGCYVVTGDSSAGKSTLARILSLTVSSTASHTVGSHLVSWGEPERGSIDGTDISTFVLELSIGLTLFRTAVVDSLRFFQLFAAGPSGSKGLSKGLLAILTSLSRTCANLGMCLFVIVHPFELSGRGLETQYRAFVGELRGAATGVIEPRWTTDGMGGVMSIRRAYIPGPRGGTGGRAPFEFKVASKLVLEGVREPSARSPRKILTTRPDGRARRTIRVVQ